MNELGMRQRLSDLCLEAGSAVKFAKKHKLKSWSHVYAVMRGEKKPGNRILKAIGLKRVLSDKKTTVMKFEDITN